MWFWGLGFSSVGMGTGGAGLGETALTPAPFHSSRLKPSHVSRLTAVALTTTVIATCAPWPGFAESAASFAERWWPIRDPDRTAAFAAIKAKEVQYWLQYETAYPEPKAEKAGGFQLASRTESPAPSSAHTVSSRYLENGLASYYISGVDGGIRTASGEDFNARALTAAHPTLPFGTRVRVTNLASGRSVTVRINDRGPFVPGRVIDVSQAAAEELGMVGRGVTKVKLDVVQ
jgi:peptidoglycan lytic transglycosylase